MTLDDPGKTQISEEVQPLAADIGPTPYHRPAAVHHHRHQPSFDGQSLIQTLLSVVIIALFVITFLMQAFVIPSESMEKTLLIGDYLLVNKVPFAQGGEWSRLMPYREIQHGDIVVFHYPVDPSVHFVKRVIGLPGDHVRLRSNKVYVNGKPLTEPYAVHQAGSVDPYRDNFPSNLDYSGQMDRHWHDDLPHHIIAGELVVPPDQYFVMGDNRDVSIDSRYWGFVPRQNMVGRPLVIYLSVKGQQSTSLGSGTARASQSARTLSHIWQLARWDRMFRLVP
ncbi:MAG: signal peptidase I [Acidobacteriia bacterium]|nr:signal peptidase I [Terriglobia bacterium]